MVNKKRKIIVLLCLFAGLLLSCGQRENLKVLFNLDGGVFTNVDDYSIDNLPIPEKEGYFFVGWCENDALVENTLEYREYNLKALWVPIFDYEYIQDNELFTRDELDYYVYLMRDGCSWCEKIKDDVLRYQYKCNLYSNIKKIYIVNLQTSKYSSLILRTYSENESGFYISNVEKWDELYIPSTPTLLEIKEADEHRTATLVESGATDIKNALKRSLIDKNDYSKTTDMYTITYELNGGSCDNLITSYNKWEKEDLRLPIPAKENSYFGGWDIFVTDTYHQRIEARWVDSPTIEEITENDIFKEDGKYYIYFYKASDDNTTFFEFIKKYNALANYYHLDQIVVLDLEKCNVIYRALPNSESTYKVDNVDNINDLYISQRKCMIYVDGVAKYIAGTNKSIINYFEKLTELNFSE